MKDPRLDDIVQDVSGYWYFAPKAGAGLYTQYDLKLIYDEMKVRNEIIDKQYEKVLA